LFQVGTAAGLSDLSLLERFADRRDEAAEVAFAGLVERHGPMVLRVCRSVLGDRDEAEDAFQATFLVLASRARAIRRGDSVGSWLHGVALRVANRARWRAARRRHHERRHAEMTASARADQIGGGHGPPDDVAQVLHEEIGRLPEKYRKPVVLCYLEGLTHDQAADQLGWPVGTVRRRLAGARDRLHGRLTRRHVAPYFLAVGPVGSGTAWDLGGLDISVPSRLAKATVCGAMRVGWGQAAPVGIISAEVIALMKGVSQAMTTSKLIAMTAAVLTAGLVTTGVGLLAYQGKPPGAPAVPIQAKDREKPGPSDVVDRSLDDQLGAILRRWDATIEANQRTAKAQMSADEREALAQANFGKLQDVNTLMLELAIRHPRTNAAEQALIWIVTHQTSPESNKAWEFLARNYARSDRIKQVLSRQRVGVGWASQAVEDLLRNTQEQNPYREIRGLACYWLAEMLEFRVEGLRLWPLLSPKQAEHWRERFSPQDFDRVIKQDPRSLEDEVARLYERIIAEFPMVENNDARCGLPPQILGRAAIHLPEVAKVHLDALRRLSAGKPAPEIEGIDLDGRPMKLSDFRGKVVVLFMGGFGLPYAYPPERAPSHLAGVFRQLARSAEGRPVALLGVVETQRETYKKEVQATGLPIRFWWDPEQAGSPVFPRVSGSRPGPILTGWDAEGPNWYVIDANGVIRYTHVFEPEMLEKAVATILKERERGADPAK